MLAGYSESLLQVLEEVRAVIDARDPDMLEDNMLQIDSVVHRALVNTRCCCKLLGKSCLLFRLRQYRCFQLLSTLPVLELRLELVAEPRSAQAVAY